MKVSWVTEFLMARVNLMATVVHGMIPIYPYTSADRMWGSWDQIRDH